MRKIAWLLVVVLIMNGCGVTAKFIYPSKRKNLLHLYETPRYDLTVAVLPFDDNRDDTNSSGGYWLSLIPLFPYGKGHYQRPDGARMFNTISEFDFNPSEDLAKAVVTSLQEANLFKDVYFTYGGEKDKADLVFKGSIESTKYEGTLITYCLSLSGVYLWLLGLPAGVSHNELSLSMETRKPFAASSLWSYNFTKRDKVIQGAYYHWGWDIKYYATLMEQGMNEAVQSLDKKLATISIDELKK